MEIESSKDKKSTALPIRKTRTDNRGPYVHQRPRPNSNTAPQTKFHRPTSTNQKPETKTKAKLKHKTTSNTNHQRKPSVRNQSPEDSHEYRYVTDSESLLALTETLRTSGSFVFDMEFLSGSTFYPLLCLIQVAAYVKSDLIMALVDPLSPLDLQPFWDLIEDPSIEKIVHDGKEEIKILQHAGVKTAKNVFDTQIAAAFCGFGTQPGLAALASDILGVHIDKTYQRSVWNKRPLSPEQQRYAINDVKHLLPIKEHLDSVLSLNGVRSCLHEEWDDLWTESARKYHPSVLYQRVDGWKTLNPIQLSVLRELAAWRDQLAKSGNYPRQWRYSDTLLIKLARVNPDPTVVLEIIQTFGKKKDDDPHVICSIISKGRQTKPYPESFSPRSGLDRQSQFSAEMAWSVTETISYSRGIHPKIVSEKADFMQIVVPHLLGRENQPDVSFFKGWRKELIADPLMIFMETGQIQVIKASTRTGS